MSKSDTHNKLPTNGTSFSKLPVGVDTKLVMSLASPDTRGQETEEGLAKVQAFLGRPVEGNGFKEVAMKDALVRRGALIEECGIRIVGSPLMTKKRKPVFGFQINNTLFLAIRGDRMLLQPKVYSMESSLIHALTHFVCLTKPNTMCNFHPWFASIVCSIANSCHETKEGCIPVWFDTGPVITLDFIRTHIKSGKVMLIVCPALSVGIESCLSKMVIDKDPKNTTPDDCDAHMAKWMPSFDAYMKKEECYHTTNVALQIFAHVVKGVPRGMGKVSKPASNKKVSHPDDSEDDGIDRHAEAVVAFPPASQQQTGTSKRLRGEEDEIDNEVYNAAKKSSKLFIDDKASVANGKKSGKNVSIAGVVLRADKGQHETLGGFLVPDNKKKRLRDDASDDDDDYNSESESEQSYQKKTRKKDHKREHSVSESEMSDSESGSDSDPSSEEDSEEDSEDEDSEEEDSEDAENERHNKERKHKVTSKRIAPSSDDEEAEENGESRIDAVPVNKLKQVTLTSMKHSDPANHKRKEIAERAEVMLEDVKECTGIPITSSHKVEMARVSLLAKYEEYQRQEHFEIEKYYELLKSHLSLHTLQTQMLNTNLSKEQRNSDATLSRRLASATTSALIDLIPNITKLKTYFEHGIEAVAAVQNSFDKIAEDIKKATSLIEGEN